MKNAELALLSLIVEKPRHGYEIEQVLAERSMRDWTEIGFSSIYYYLNKLEQNGLIASKIEMPVGRGPARKVYAITADGLRNWYLAGLESLSALTPQAFPFLLGLSILPAFAKEDAIAAISKYRDQIQARKDNILAQRAAHSQAPEHIDALFDYSLTMVTAELVWVEQFIERLSQPMPQPPGL